MIYVKTTKSAAQNGINTEESPKQIISSFSFPTIEKTRNKMKYFLSVLLVIIVIEVCDSRSFPPNRYRGYGLYDRKRDGKHSGYNDKYNGGHGGGIHGGGYGGGGGYGPKPPTKHPHPSTGILLHQNLQKT